MEGPTQSYLSRREREIMDVVYSLGQGSVSDIAARMEDNPGYNSVRVTLGILVKKGHLKHRKDGRRYIYSPTVPTEAASRSATRNLLRTFFGGSPSRAILAMLDASSDRLSRKQLDDITAWLEKVKKEK